MASIADKVNALTQSIADLNGQISKMTAVNGQPNTCSTSATVRCASCRR